MAEGYNWTSSNGGSRLHESEPDMDELYFNLQLAQQSANRNYTITNTPVGGNVTGMDISNVNLQLSQQSNIRNLARLMSRGLNSETPNLAQSMAVTTIPDGENFVTPHISDQSANHDANQFYQMVMPNRSLTSYNAMNSLETRNPNNQLSHLTSGYGSILSLVNSNTDFEHTNRFNHNLNLQQAAEPNERSITPGISAVDVQMTASSNFQTGVYSRQIQQNSYNPKDPHLTPSLETNSNLPLFLMTSNIAGCGEQLQNAVPSGSLRLPNSYERYEKSVRYLQQGFLPKTSPLSIDKKFGKCSVHRHFASRFFCKQHQIAVCCACVIELIGQHGNCSVTLKILSDESESKRERNTVALQALVKQIFKVLNRKFDVPPIVFNIAFDISLFDEKLKSNNCSEVSSDVIYFLKTINKLIIDLAGWDDNHEKFNFQITEAQNRFRDITKKFFPSENEKETKNQNFDLVGQGITEVVRGIRASFFIVCKSENASHHKIECVASPVYPTFVNPKIQCKISQYHFPRVWLCSFEIPVSAFYEFEVKIDGVNVHQSPFQVFSQPRHQFHSTMTMVGQVGDQFNFNRPWGVCNDKNGNIYISDRCNDNIKVFDSNFNFKMVFSGSGSKIGLLKKPCGITIDRVGDIVVCDKDNHRIQVFSPEGVPLRQSPQNNGLEHPWAVAVNSKNEYIVTHSKEKLSILTPDLEIYKEININVDIKKLHPRGVTVGYLDEILFTCFEHGGVYEVDLSNNKTRVKFFTVHPNAPQGSKRLQGLCVDENGFILIADSKNNCIEAYTYIGDFVTRWSTLGKPLNIIRLKGKEICYMVMEEESTKNVCLYKNVSWGM